MEHPLYHLVLDGRKVGPYDRRTIVGMRIRKTLTSEQVVVGADGVECTVGDLIGQGRPDFQPQRTGNFGVVRATYPGCVRSVRGAGPAIPRFQGEVELRVKADVLRIAGRIRKGLAWKDTRVKLPLADFVHASAQGSEVDLGLRTAKGLQRIRLDLFTQACATELLQWLPQAGPWPAGAGGAEGAPRPGAFAGGMNLMWLAGAGATAVVLVLIAVALGSRLY